MAFRILAAARVNTGFSLSPITLQDIKAYLEMVGPPWMDVPIFIEIIIAMDQKFLELERAKGEKGGGKT